MQNFWQFPHIGGTLECLKTSDTCRNIGKASQNCLIVSREKYIIHRNTSRNRPNLFQVTCSFAEYVLNIKKVCEYLETKNIHIMHTFWKQHFHSEVEIFVELPDDEGEYDIKRSSLESRSSLTMISISEWFDNLLKWILPLMEDPD